MPHSTGSQDDADDQEINRLLAGDENGPAGFDFQIPELEPGEKANDAVDYEDIDDDDLADEEDLATIRSPARSEQPEDRQVRIANGGHGQNGFLEDLELPDTQNDATINGGELEDLFGDTLASTSGPVESQDAHVNGKDGGDLSFGFEAEELPPTGSSDTATIPIFSQDERHNSLEPPALKMEEEERQENFQQRPAKLDTSVQSSIFDFHQLPAPPENKEEALAAMWPKFKTHEIPNFMELLPPKKSHYVGKTPLKPPKVIQPTKLNLEIAQDQERMFRSTLPAAGAKRPFPHESEAAGLVRIADDDDRTSDGSDVDGLETMSTDMEPIRGVTWNDLQMVCEDWDAAVTGEVASDEEMVAKTLPPRDEDDLFGDEGDDWGVPPAKRLKPSVIDKSFFSRAGADLPSFEDPERWTQRIAKRVYLDMNDPHLLLESAQPDAKRQRRHGADSGRPKDLNGRYNISNDEAYDMLKENHQSKIRSTLSNLTVEHSLPAVRLQYPYYKVRLGIREARSFHRPSLSFYPNVPVRFSRAGVTKRKHLRGKDTLSIFPTTKHLSLGDNSNVLLLEYSEECPSMMSNFGMHNRVINYYRRKNAEDNARPKLDVGETAVLMPHDKSPFAMFGDIDSGQLLPTLYNGMFKAPVFKQNPKSNDFLVIRNTTGVEGSFWYMRNVENLYVVGQQLPSTEVPGPHSRKVTTAAKNRLKMISYRKIRKSKYHRVNVPDITEHFPDSTDMQNRQKMKEFLQYSKDSREWEMRPGEPIPEETNVRTLMKPEDVCLLESSQVGQRHLQDAGYDKDVDESEEEEAKEGQSVEQQLAPWQTTKNFLQAVQGKAMLQLHGEGDPSGRGEAFSFIRTSMKGGFKAIGESVEEKLDAKKLKEMGGHSYNVARQQKAYNDSIRRIWDAQNTSLSSTVDHDEGPGDDEVGDAPEDVFEEGRTPRSEAVTPGAIGGVVDDDIGSQFSKFSSASQRGRVLRISRTVKNSKGQSERVQEIIRDPRVIRQYLKRRHALEAEQMALSELRPTGDAEQDRRAQKRIEEELARLERNKDRRIARDKAKGIYDGGAGSPGSADSPSAVGPKASGTQRKCANCGQVGHIKTNKKLCPMLNGTMAPDAGFPTDTTGFSSLG